MAEKNIDDASSIQGISASAGKRIGRVKLVFNIDQLQKINEGDILVSPMTNPDMVLAMGKCAAIVTDSGGITSHAAIISRELGIPCVTGTQNATKILRDGVLIEVDGTHGIVNILEGKLDPQNTSAQFTIFGNNVTPFYAKIVRDEPLCPKIDYQWIKQDMTQAIQWIIPRPEIYGSIIQRSFSASGIEGIPHAFNFDDIGPLQVRYYDNVAIGFDQAKIILLRLNEKLIKCDEDFWKNYLSSLRHHYIEFDRATQNFVKIINDMEKLPPEKLIQAFIDWWSIHNKFFSRTYLIQSMGDDIVWPFISEMLSHVFNDKNKTAEYITILSATILESEFVVSKRFALETTSLVKTAPRAVKELIFSNANQEIVLQTTKSTEEGREWIKVLDKHTEKWWWIRERDPYFDPILDNIGMLSFIRKYVSQGLTEVNLNVNREKYNQAIEMLKLKMSSSTFNQFSFLLDVGRILNQERDNHHHYWMRNVSYIRGFFTKNGLKFKQQRILQHEKDVFFLTFNEVLSLIAYPELAKTSNIQNKIENRIAHISQRTKLDLHRKPSVTPPAHFDDIF